MDKNLFIIAILISILIIFIFFVAPPERGKDFRNYDLIEHLQNAEIVQHTKISDTDFGLKVIPIKKEFFRLLQRLVADEKKVLYPLLPYKTQAGEKPYILYIKYYDLIRENYTPVTISFDSDLFSLRIKISELKTEMYFTSTGDDPAIPAKLSKAIETDNEDELYFLQFNERLIVIAGEKLLLNYSDNNAGFDKGNLSISPNWEKKADVSSSVSLVNINQYGIKRINQELRFLYYPSSESKPLHGIEPKGNIHPVHRMEKDISTRALLISPNQTLEYNLIVPPDSRFEYLYKFEGLTKSSNYTANLVIKNQAGECLEDRALHPGTTEWNSGNIDLQRFESRRIKIEISFIAKAKPDGGEVLLLANPVFRTRREQGEYNVLFLFLDTLRADHLGCYGYDKDTSPNIDKLGAEGIIFDNTFSQSNWTLPSAASFFTSLYPSEALPFLGVDGYINYDLNLNPYMLSIGEYFKRAGYKTAAFTGNGWVGYKRGFDRGFETYEHTEMVVDKEKKGLDRSVDKIIHWIEQNKDLKWFLMLHTYEIHSPYIREPFYTYDENQIAGEVIARYDSGIRYTDQQIGRIIETLKSAGIYNNTIIIVMSDHGERFVNQFTGKAVAEKMGLHGYTLYDCETHVPLIISGGPVCEYTGKRVKKITGLVDILPTMLDLVDIKIHSNLRGSDLMEFIDDDNEIEELVFSERYLNQDTYFSIRSDQHKLIFHTDEEGKKELELYNIQIDPEEAFNIAGNSLKIETLMKNQLNEFMQILTVEKNRYTNLLLTPVR